LRPSLTIALLACSLAMCQSTGCTRCPDTHVSAQDVVWQYNANARLVDKLWARAEIHITMPGVFPFAANGLLLLSKVDDPLGCQNFVLIGYETLAVELFRLGTSAAEGKYYFWYGLGDQGKCWWGRHELAGGPGLTDMPINPNQLLSVLGICALPDDFSQLPTVALAMSHSPGEPLRTGERCAYVLTYIDTQPITSRILFRREMYFNWDDAPHRRPFMVKLLNANGDRIMSARLRNYQSVDIGRPGPKPFMPTDIKISWPARQSSVRVLLSEMTTEDKWDTESCLFQAQLPGWLAPTDMTQVDAHLQSGGQQQ